MGIPISSEVNARLEQMFAQEDRLWVRDLLEDECANNIPGYKSAGIDRLRMAMLKLSRGSISELSEAIELAKKDFRDALVYAGFAEDIRAHEKWWPEKPTS